MFLELQNIWSFMEIYLLFRFLLKKYSGSQYFYVAVAAPAYNTGCRYCQIYVKMQFLINKIMLVKRARCASSFLAINTYATFCSYYHFFQTERQMSTIKLMAASLV